MSIKKLLIITFLICFHNVFSQSKHEQIKIKLKKLTTLIGEWEVESSFTSRKGKTRNENGVYKFSWALDSTYILLTGKLKNIKTGRERELISWITYDKSKSAYRQNYIHSKTASQFEAFGYLDSTQLIYATINVFTLSDGTIETLRNEMHLSNSDELIYKGWAKFNNEKEVNNMNVVLRRKNEH